MLELGHSKILSRILILLLTNILQCIKQAETFNISPVPSIIIKKPDIMTFMPEKRSSYFGYSIVLREKSIIIGAPRAQSTIEYQKNINETGAIYRCLWPGDSNLNATCQPYIFTDKGNIKKDRKSELRDFQMLGAAMDGSGKDADKLLVCAPGFAGVYDPDSSSMQGVCYWSLNTLSDKPEKAKDWTVALSTAQNVDKIYENRADLHYYKLGEGGFSAHITPDDEEFLIGAPGILEWQGSTLRYNIRTQKTHIPDSRHCRTYFSYRGYAVASGYLNNRNRKQLFYVVTIPHPKYPQGEVHIFDEKYAEPYLKKLHGIQYGEYFGYAVLVSDVNGDNLPDVLITAPQYSLNGQTDVGAVHVFLNREELNFERKLLKSPFSDMARFGTTISNLGDINQDGFNDTAIGAPFTGNAGAVAIYLGSAEGLQQKPSQIIKFDSANVQMFGHALSKGVDIDDNGFNDLAIGAPESEMVFVYKSYPVVEILSTMSVQPTKIEPKDVVQTLSIKIDWQFHTKSNKINEIPILLKLTADSRLKRVTFKQSESHTLELNNRYAYNFTESENITATVKYSAGHIFTPIYLELNHELLDDGTKAKEFCDHCTVLHPNKSASSQQTITFNHKCKGKVCQVDLELKSTNVPKTFLKGTADTFPISYNITNKGEKAYDAHINITTDPHIEFAMIPSKCRLETEEHKLICQLTEEQAFENRANATVELLLDVSNITRAMNLKIVALVGSSGNEPRDDDNIIESIVVLEEHAEILITGKHSYNLKMIQSVYELENVGPSTLYDRLITFWTPYAILDSTHNETYDIFNIKNTTITVEDDNGYMQLSDYLEPSRYMKHQAEFDVQTNISEDYVIRFGIHTNRSIMLNCSNIQVSCAKRIVNVKDFPPHRKITLHIEYELKPKNVKSLMKASLESIVVIPTLSIDKQESTIILGGKIDPIEINRMEAPPPPIWIFIFGAIGGLTILSMLVYALLKNGFFQRKIKEQLSAQKEIKKLARYSVIAENEIKARYSVIEENEDNHIYSEIE